MPENLITKRRFGSEDYSFSNYDSAGDSPYQKKKKFKFGRVNSYSQSNTLSHFGNFKSTQKIGSQLTNVLKNDIQEEFNEVNDEKKIILRKSGSEIKGCNLSNIDKVLEKSPSQSVKSFKKSIQSSMKKLKKFQKKKNKRKHCFPHTSSYMAEIASGNFCPRIQCRRNKSLLPKLSKDIVKPFISNRTQTGFKTTKNSKGFKHRHKISSFRPHHRKMYRSQKPSRISNKKKSSLIFSDEDTSSKISQKEGDFESKINDLIDNIPVANERKMHLLELNKPYLSMKELKKRSIRKNIYQAHNYQSNVFVLDPKESKMLKRIKQKNKSKLVEIFINRENHFRARKKGMEEYLNP